MLFQDARIVRKIQNASGTSIFLLGSAQAIVCIQLGEGLP